ncbi:MAG: Crp/Fnr family transcriptional regulator [Bacteroidota bacterium]
MIDINVMLAWGANYKKYNAGEIIFQEGGVCNYYFQLTEGRVRWVNYNLDGKEFIQSIIEPNESFGELPLFDDGPFAATAITDTDSLILRLPKQLFVQLLKENPEINFEFSRLLAHRQRYEFMLLKTMAFEKPEERIWALLSYFKNKPCNLNKDPYLVNLTRQQIANMTGLRVETVIREIKHMSDKGRLKIKRGKVFM